MKRVLFAFAAFALLLASCTKEPVDNSQDGGSAKPAELILKISVASPDGDTATKAYIKTGWTRNDIINIWFDRRKETKPDLVIKYNGTTWERDETAATSGFSFSGDANGYAKSIYSDKLTVFSCDNYTFDSQTNCLTINISKWKFLTKYQVVISGIDNSATSDWTLSGNFFCPYAGYELYDDYAIAVKGDKGAAVKGIENADGVAFVFADIEGAVMEQKYSFTLTYNKHIKEGGSVTNIPVTKTYLLNAKIGSSDDSKIKGFKIDVAKFYYPATFSSGTKKVRFANGNVYAKKNAGSWTWGFYDKQWMFNSLSMGKTSRTATAEDTEIDHFCWGYIEGKSVNPLDIDERYSFTDWSNAQPSDFPPAGPQGWRTPTNDEWDYIFNGGRAGGKIGEAENARFLFCKVNGYAGVLLFPDGFTWPDSYLVSIKPDESLINISSDVAKTFSTEYTALQFELLESNGCVFLPATGWRSAADQGVVKSIGTNMNYWSSSSYSQGYSYYAKITDKANYCESRLGQSVRLITEILE